MSEIRYCPACNQALRADREHACPRPPEQLDEVFRVHNELVDRVYKLEQDRADHRTSFLEQPKSDDPRESFIGVTHMVPPRSAVRDEDLPPKRDDDSPHVELSAADAYELADELRRCSVHATANLQHAEWTPPQLPFKVIIKP